MKARVSLDREFAIGPIDPRMWGSFVEHLGRCIYGGIYEPGHPSADAMGFRRDVMEVIKELRLPIIRYPGGNYTSSYEWLDSVGPVESRRARPDLAWRSLEPNTFGLDEFVRWTNELPSDILMTLNMGTQGLQEALDLLEYCNFDRGSYFSDLRREHGRENPYGITHWCLGNEIDGPWQVGQKSAAEYGHLANETAKAMKLLDPEVLVSACGSSFREMPTFPEWDQTVLEACYENVDYLSLHTYLRNAYHDRATYLAEFRKMEDYLDTAIAVCDNVKLRKNSTKTLPISFDEWNVWPRAKESDRDLQPWRVGPPLLEEAYTMEDAVVFGSMVNVLLRHADRVAMACMSLLVNAISPIMTENGGPVWRQTTYYPFKYGSLYGRGRSMRVLTECDTYENGVYGTIPYLDVSAAFDDGTGELALFAVNRSEGEKMQLELSLSGFGTPAVEEIVTLEAADPNSGNTREDPEAIVPHELTTASGKVASVELPAFSWTMIRLKTPA